MEKDVILVNEGAVDILIFLQTVLAMLVHRFEDQNDNSIVLTV